MKTTLLAVLLFFFTFAVFADVPVETGNRIYIPTFMEWVSTAFAALYKIECDDYFIATVCKPTKDNQAFRIWFVVRAKRNLVGRKYLYETWPVVKESIIVQCFNWTLRGYPIGEEDIDFDVDWWE